MTKALSFEEFMEKMYSVKLEDQKPWTPEEREKNMQALKEAARRMKEDGAQLPPPGQEDI